MKTQLTLKFIILANLCFGQGTLILNTISKKDSLDLSKTIKTYITAIENKDLKTIKTFSLNIVDCEMCITNEGLDKPIEDAFVKTDTFALYLFNSLQYSQLWKNIKSGIFEMESTSSSQDMYHPKSVDLKQVEYFTEFELSYFIDNSSSKYYFSFVKIKNKFKLW